MSTIRRMTQLLGAVALGVVGVLLVLEGTEVSSGVWRRNIADEWDRFATPTWSLWISALAGAGAAVAGVVMFGAQFAPEKKGMRSMHNVYSDGDGSTQLRGRAAISAVRHEVAKIDGVVEVAPTIRRKRMTVDIKIDDRANVAEVEQEARSKLDHGFWIDLGLADYTVELLITHHPKPPRVR